MKEKKNIYILEPKIKKEEHMKGSILTVYWSTVKPV